MSKHTPGPWLYEPADSGDDSVGIQATPPYIFADPQSDGCVVPICTIDNPCRRADRPLVDEYDDGTEWIGDDVANARLIAAAPELYEACEAAWNCIGELPPTQARVEVAQMLCAALAKAKGEAA
jgi:hypothetical protein